MFSYRNLIQYFSAALGIVLLLYCSARKSHESMLLDSRFVNLRGKTSTTIITNSTKDSLRITGIVYGILPWTEESNTIVIPQGGTDSLFFIQNFPDFIEVELHNSALRIFNAPGQTVSCNILAVDSAKRDVQFGGAFAEVNEYYLARLNKLGFFYEQNRPYFLAGDTVKNFNNYPALVDTISAMSLRLLREYPKPLPEWFTAYEYARIAYQAGWIKYNCPMTKEFYEARTIPKLPSYFDFGKALAKPNDSIILSKDYLVFLGMFMSHHAQKKDSIDGMRYPYHFVDSVYGATKWGDVARLMLLSDAIHSSMQRFRDELKLVKFADTSFRTMLDTVVMKRLAVPKVGQPSPDILLTSTDSKQIQLSSFKGSLLLVNFWASWCGPCIKELPADNKLYRTYKDKGLTVINICVQTRKEKWQELSKQHDLQMINLYCKNEDNELLGKIYDLNALPRSILIGSDFTVLENYSKRASDWQDADVKKLLTSLK